MAHLIAHPAVVVAVKGLAHEDEVRLHAAHKVPELAQVVGAEAVGHIQAQSVNIELVHPVADGVKLVLDHGGVV